MKNLIVCLALVAFVSTPVFAGEKCAKECSKNKTASKEACSKTKAAGCPLEAKKACQGASKQAALTKGAQGLTK